MRKIRDNYLEEKQLGKDRKRFSYDMKELHKVIVLQEKKKYSQIIFFITTEKKITEDNVNLYI